MGKIKNFKSSIDKEIDFTIKRVEKIKQQIGRNLRKSGSEYEKSSTYT